VISSFSAESLNLLVRCWKWVIYASALASIRSSFLTVSPPRPPDPLLPGLIFLLTKVLWMFGPFPVPSLLEYLSF